MEPVTAKHIESSSDICGGKPTVAGTRIRVWDIHVWHNLRGQSPEEIVSSFPELTVSAVHAALAYYLDNRVAIEQQMDESEALVDSVESKQRPTRFSRLRDEILQSKDVHGDSDSS